MAGEIGVSDELGGSLFEGMVLFSHSDLLISSSSQEKSPRVLSPFQNQVHPEQLPLSPLLSASSISTHLQSKPLDEDIFSDLSLQSQTEPSNSHQAILAIGQTFSTAAPSRLVSRKKKRALRIGYGRESIDAMPAVSVDDPPNSTEDSIRDFSSNSTPLASSHCEELAPIETVLSSGEASDGDGLLCVRAGSYCDDKALTSTSTLEKKDASELIKENLQLLRSKIFLNLEQIRATATSVLNERKELERRRRRAGQDANEVSCKYKNLEAQLQEVCEAEDFERAERLSELLAAAEKEKDALLNILRETELNCEYADSKMQELINLQIASQEEEIELLQKFAKEATDQADLIYKGIEELSSQDLNDWQSSMELLEMSKLEIDIEAELILNARSALHNSIENAVKYDREEVELLTKKRITLAKELDDLLKFVRLKEAEITENESQILQAERKISEVVSEVQKRSSSIDLEHDKLKSVFSRIDLEQEALLEKKNEIDAFISLSEQKCLHLRELANTVLDEAKTCQDIVELRKESASSILKFREYKVQLVRTEERIKKEILALHQKISSTRTTLKELSSARVSNQQEIDLLKQQIAFIEKRGPYLETEKKNAAAARNFKEAGRIAVEAKALISEKESLQNKLGITVLNLEKLDGDIKSNIREMQENEELAFIKEKEAAVATFKRLKLIAAVARSERSAGLKLDDLEEDEFLLKEAEAAEESVRDLQEAYNIDPEELKDTEKYLVTKFSGFILTEMAGFLKQSVADA